MKFCVSLKFYFIVLGNIKYNILSIKIMKIIIYNYLNIFQSVLRMKVRLSYVIDGNPVQDQIEVNNFPSDIWD